MKLLSYEISMLVNFIKADASMRAILLQDGINNPRVSGPLLQAYRSVQGINKLLTYEIDMLVNFMKQHADARRVMFADAVNNPRVSSYLLTAYKKVEEIV